MRNSIQGISLSAFVGLLVALPQKAMAEWNINTTRQDATGFGVATSTPSSILINIINYALAILGFLGILGFIIAGVMYILSAGDEASAKKAKGYMVNSIIGVIIALLGYVVIAAISTLLGAGGATTGL